MDGAIAALAGALIGATAGVAGQLLTIAYTSRNERRRLAVEAGFREWEQAYDHAKTLQRRVQLYPPVLFMYFNHELLRLVDSRKGLTPDNYKRLVERKDQMRRAIDEDSERRSAEVAGSQS